MIWARYKNSFCNNLLDLGTHPLRTRKRGLGELGVRISIRLPLWPPNRALSPPLLHWALFADFRSWSFLREERDSWGSFRGWFAMHSPCAADAADRAFHRLSRCFTVVVVLKPFVSCPRAPRPPTRTRTIPSTSAHLARFSWTSTTVQVRRRLSLPRIVHSAREHKNEQWIAVQYGAFPPSSRLPFFARNPFSDLDQKGELLRSSPFKKTCLPSSSPHHYYQPPVSI